MKRKVKREHELDRTEILRYLVECGFQPVTPKFITDHMDDVYQPVSDDGMEFHLRYMAGKGWVELGEERIPGQAPRLLWTKVTPAGVDELDRRSPGESGVRS